MSDRIFILGAGRFGTHLALRLSELGCDVQIADSDARLVQDLSEGGFRAIRIDADDPGDLKAAGVPDADVVVVAIGENMQASILSVLTLKEMGAKRVIGRAINDKHAQILTKLGADQVVAPARESALRLAEQIDAGSREERHPIEGEFHLGQVRLGPRLAGIRVEEAALSRKFKLTPVLVVRTDEGGGRKQEVPLPELVLHEGDLIYVAGHKEDINTFEEKCGGKKE
ncbi:MAG: TrkA family potassium uptake protein [Limisphaerales bacterium]